MIRLKHSVVRRGLVNDRDDRQRGAVKKRRVPIWL